MQCNTRAVQLTCILFSVHLTTVVYSQHVGGHKKPLIEAGGVRVASHVFSNIDTFGAPCTRFGDRIW